MTILIQRLLYNTINTGLPDHFAGQHRANIGRKFSDLSLRSQKEIFFFPPLPKIHKLCWNFYALFIDEPLLVSLKPNIRTNGICNRKCGFYFGQSTVPRFHMCKIETLMFKYFPKLSLTAHILIIYIRDLDILLQLLIKNKEDYLEI